MCAENDIGVELFEITRKSRARIAGKQVFDPIHPFCDFELIGLRKHHSPKLRRVRYQLHIAIRDNFSMQRGEKLEQIDALNDVRGTQLAPGLVEGGGGGEMAAAGGYRCEQEADSECRNPKNECRNPKEAPNPQHSNRL